jgi:hypothetical protein
MIYLKKFEQIFEHRVYFIKYGDKNYEFGQEFEVVDNKPAIPQDDRSWYDYEGHQSDIMFNSMRKKMIKSKQSKRNPHKKEKAMIRDVKTGKIDIISTNKLSSMFTTIYSSLKDYENKNIYTFEDIKKLNYSTANFPFGTNPIVNIWNLFRDHNLVDYFNDLDIIREDDGEYYIIIDRLNYFLESINKPKVVSVKGYKCI